MTQYSRRGILKGAAASLFVSPAGAALGADAGALSRATWRFFHSGTNKSAAVFADSRLTDAHADPVVADVSGLFPAIYLDPAVSYRAMLSTAAGATLQDVDPYQAAHASDSVVTVQMYGAVGDGVTDDTAAFEAAIYKARPELNKLRINVPEGNYLLSRQIIPRRQIELVGAGMEVTRLIFKDVASSNVRMRGALAFGLGSTLAAYTTNPDGYPVSSGGAGGSDFSHVRDLSIFITGTRPKDFHYGIWSAARLVCERVDVHYGGFKLCGGNLIIGSGSVAGNANMSRLLHCRSSHSTEDSYFTDGSDANAITFVACNSWAPARIGFHDGSFLGNSYTGCIREAIQGNTVNGYKSVGGAGVNKSTFIGCYNEGDEMSGPRWNIGSPGLIIGWQGARPETNLGGHYNTSLDASNTSGLVTLRMINAAADGDGYSLGSASVRASRMSTDGFYVRGQDGALYSMEIGAGAEVFLQRAGVAVMKIVKGAAIPDPTGGATVDTEARAAIAAILARMRALTPTIDS